LFAIYYDDPNTVKEKSKMRGPVGYIVHDYALRDEFIQNNDYDSVDVPAMPAVNTYFPIVNDLSYQVLGKRVYPALYNYLYERKIDPDLILEGMIEVYHFDEKEKVVEVILPFGSKAENYFLTLDPEPEQLNLKAKME
jgi:hypothetical protein